MAGWVASRVAGGIRMALKLVKTRRIRPSMALKLAKTHQIRSSMACWCRPRAVALATGRVWCSPESVEGKTYEVTYIAHVCAVNSMDRLNIFNGEKVKEHIGNKWINRQTQARDRYNIAFLYHLLPVENVVKHWHFSQLFMANFDAKTKPEALGSRKSSNNGFWMVLKISSYYKTDVCKWTTFSAEPTWGDPDFSRLQMSRNITCVRKHLHFPQNPAALCTFSSSFYHELLRRCLSVCRKIFINWEVSHFHHHFLRNKYEGLINVMFCWNQVCKAHFQCLFHFSKSFRGCCNVYQFDSSVSPFFYVA